MLQRLFSSLANLILLSKQDPCYFPISRHGPIHSVPGHSSSKLNSPFFSFSFFTSFFLSFAALTGSSLVDNDDAFRFAESDSASAADFEIDEL
jgi:hypothetical protein